MDLTLKQKGILTIISAIFIHLNLGNIYTWSIINPYLISYVYIQNKDINLEIGPLIVAICLSVDTYVTFPGGIIEKYLGKYGTRIYSILGISTSILLHLIIYLSKNIYLIGLGFVLFGIGIGCSYFPIMKTCWKYFPEKKGIITGIILCSFGFSSMIFSFIAEKLFIKYDKIKYPLIKNIYYDEIIEKPFRNFLLFMIIFLGIIGFTGILIMFPLDDIDSTDQDEKGSTLLGEEENATNNDTSNNDNNDGIIKNTNLDQPFQQAVYDRRFMMFNI